MDIDRQIRAFNPWPTAETRLDGEPVKLLRSCVEPGRHAPAGVVPGSLIGLGGAALEWPADAAILQVLELQRAGRKPVAARDFYNALRLAPDARAVFA